ncbi:hypothetical protein FDK38_000829 [Candidozyma auris]|nr:hypothetical protein FDK38_000829 [[Candida] auris]
MSPSYPGNVQFPYVDTHTHTASTDEKVTCEVTTALDYLEQVMKPCEGKSHIPIKLEGARNYQEWKFEWSKWVAGQHFICQHYALNLISKKKIDHSVEGFYAEIEKEELNKIITKVESLLLSVVHKSIDFSKFKTNECISVPYGKLMTIIIRHCEKDPGTIFLSELKSRVSSRGSHEKTLKHISIYGQPNWKINLFENLVDPFRISEEKFEKFWEVMTARDFDKQVLAASRADKQSNVCPEILVFEELTKLLKREIGLKHESKDKSKSSNGAESDGKPHQKWANPNKKKGHNSQQKPKFGSEHNVPNVKNALVSNVNVLPYKRCSATWDTGADVHVTSDRDMMWDCEEIQIPVKGVAGVTQTSGFGTMKVEFMDGTQVILNNVAYIPDADLIYSETAGRKDGISITIEHNKLIRTDTKAIVGTFATRGKIYLKIIPKMNIAINQAEVPDSEISSPELDDAFSEDENIEEVDSWEPLNSKQQKEFDAELQLHRKFGHPGARQFKIMKKKAGLPPGRDFSYHNCYSCAASKSIRLYPKLTRGHTLVNHPLEVTHVDLCGDFNSAYDGSQYFLTIVDRYTRYVTVYLLKRKTSASERVIEYYKNAMNFFNGKCKPRILRCDNGTEFMNPLSGFLETHGISKEATHAHSSYQNGIAERMHRSLMDIARTLLIDAGASVIFWPAAIRHAAEIYNLQPRGVNDASELSPLENWCAPREQTPKQPDLLVFGTEVIFAYNYEDLQSKFHARNHVGCYLGVAQNRSHHRIFTNDPLHVFDCPYVVSRKRFYFKEYDVDVSKMSWNSQEFETMKPLLSAPRPPPTLKRTTSDAERRRQNKLIAQLFNRETGPKESYLSQPTTTPAKQARKSDTTGETNEANSSSQSNAEPHPSSVTETSSRQSPVPISDSSPNKDTITSQKSALSEEDSYDSSSLVQQTTEPTAPRSTRRQKRSRSPPVQGESPPSPTKSSAEISSDSAHPSTNSSDSGSNTQETPSEELPSSSTAHPPPSRRNPPRLAKRAINYKQMADPDYLSKATAKLKKYNSSRTESINVKGRDKRLRIKYVVVRSLQVDPDLDDSVDRLLRSSNSDSGNHKTDDDHLLDEPLDGENYVEVEETLGKSELQRQSEIPLTFQRAKQSSDHAKWMKACDEEMDAHDDNGTFYLVPRPACKRIIKNRWVFRIKDNGIYKARLVAKGFTQIKGVDYEETYAPVIKYTSVRSLIAAAAGFGMTIHQMDVKTAFLYGELKEEVYMEQPEGYIDEAHPDHVLRLKKAIYGLKQAPLVWNENINQFLQTLDFVRNEYEPCLYSRVQNGRRTLIGLYVDDILVASDDLSDLNSVKDAIKHKYKVKDMGVAKKYLNMNIETTENGIKMHLRDYITEMLHKFGMTECHSKSTPMDTKVDLTVNENEKVADQSLYRSIIGMFVHAANTLRPDIAYATSHLARYSSCPREKHMIAARRVIAYLKHTIDVGLCYNGPQQNSDFVCSCYADASFGNSEDRRSVSGRAFVLNGAAIQWKSKLQTVCTDSTFEAELVSIHSTAKEAEWLLFLLRHLGVKQDVMTIQNDNLTTIGTIKDKTKSPSLHRVPIGTKLGVVRESIERGIIGLQHVTTDLNCADLLTKPLPRVTLKSLSNIMGLRSEH